MLKVYFGHPINTYNTELEAGLIRKIRDKFTGWRIENPNQEHHQNGYREWKEKYGNGMDYYYRQVLPWCSAGIFLPFRDGKWGMGVFGEAEFLTMHGYPIFQITHDLLISRVEDINLVPVLSLEETRKRIRTASGEPAPY